MVNSMGYLVAGAITILKNMSERQWGWDDIPYMKWKISNVPNHQPVMFGHMLIFRFFFASDGQWIKSLLSSPD